MTTVGRLSVPFQFGGRPLAFCGTFDGDFMFPLGILCRVGHVTVRNVSTTLIGCVFCREQVSDPGLRRHGARDGPVHAPPQSVRLSAQEQGDC